MTWEQWISITALLLAIVAAVVGVIVLRRLNRASAPSSQLTGPTPPGSLDATGPPAFIVNPTKVSIVEFQEVVRELTAELGLPEPLWFTTTITDPGTGQTLTALRDTPSTVIAVGGDGTVRAVAGAASGSGVPMGLVPMGTGNLFARNLDLPMNSTRALIRTALTGQVHAIDIGWAHPTPPATSDPDSGPEELSTSHQPTPFLVMGGVGFDAQMVADADAELKSRFGWIAYFVAGIRHLHGKKLHARLTFDGGPPTDARKVRTVLVANVGRLPGGLVLFPDAAADNGRLEVATIDTRGGVIGWASLFGTVVLQGLGVSRRQHSPISELKSWRVNTARVELDPPANLQVDGDLVGLVSAVEFRVDGRNLLMRTTETGGKPSGSASPVGSPTT